MHDEWDHKTKSIHCDSRSVYDVLCELEHLLSEDEAQTLVKLGTVSTDEYTWFEIQGE